MTEKEALEKVREDGGALGRVPEAQRTEAVCAAAVGQCGMALCYAPAGLRERVRAAVESGRTA
jgi:hypothetical protein